MLNKNETSNTLTLLVQVYLNYFHLTGTQQAAETQLLVGDIGSNTLSFTSSSLS